MKVFWSSIVRIQLLFAVFAVGTLQAGELELRPDSLRAWGERVDAVGRTLRRQLEPSRGFVWAHQTPERAARLRAGDIVVWPVGETNPERVPSGLIHNWEAAAFFPRARVEDVLSVVRDYNQYKEVYRPGVLDARLLRRDGFRDEFTVTFRNTSLSRKTALDAACISLFSRVDATRWYIVTSTTQIREIDDYGGPREHQLPVGRGHGYLWRLHKVTRLEERDGGVYVDVETMALSRDVPGAIRWILEPIIRHLAADTLAASLEKTRAAVGAKAAGRFS